MATTALATAFRSARSTFPPHAARLAMGLSGVVLLGDPALHLAGNLGAFLGAEAFNRYADTVKANVPLLAAVRIIPGVALVIHVVAGIHLAQRSRHARPVGYAAPARGVMSRARMLVTGLGILAFLVFHLGHFTVGVVQPEHFHAVDAHGRHDVHAMLVNGLRTPWAGALYALALVVLFRHAAHAASQVVRTLGFSPDAGDVAVRRAGTLYAAVILGGFAALLLGAWSGRL